MKPLVILIALLCVGCGENKTAYTYHDTKVVDHRDSVTVTRYGRYLFSIHIKGCDYVALDGGYGYGASIAHAGDCPNPKHGEGR